MKGSNTYRIICFVLIFVFYLLPASLYAQTNEGTKFWFGFMQHRDVGENTMVAMVTSKYNTSGTISVPLQGWSQTFNVFANQVTLITLPGFVENIGSESIEGLGVLLTSEDPVSVYIHQYFNFRSEASLVLPDPSIGKEYYVMAYTGVFEMGEMYPSEFLIVATQDNTTIDISLTASTQGGLTNGDIFSITLNEGETYQVRASSATGDMAGTRLVGDKAFSVFGGNSWTEVPNGCEARDNLLEQMYPVGTWGKQIVTVPNAKVNGDLFRVMAAEDNTTVEVIGPGVYTFNLDAGEFIEYERSVATLVTGDKPIQVAQFNKGTGCSGYSLGDPSMVLLNSIEQTRDTVTLYNSSFQNISENYINIIFATDDLPFVTFDGQAITASGAALGTVGMNSEYTYARLQVSQGAHTIISEACGVIATAYGYGQVESYAYSGGASFKNINANPIPEGGCLNDTIFFDTGLSPTRYLFQWDLGDGTMTTESSFEHFYPNLGTYPVELIITDQCLGTMDTLYRDLLITLRQAVEASGDTTLCEGGSFALSSTDLSSASFEWTGPNAYFSNNQYPVVNNATPDMSGEYSVIGIVSGCATFPAFTNVEIVSNPRPDLGPDTIFCNINEATFLNPGNFSDYLWQDGTGVSSYRVREEGEYRVEVMDEYGCVGVDSVLMTQICPTEIFVPNVFSPNFDGTNDYFQVFGHDIISMRLRVFDRWGNFVFEGNSQEEKWDGTFKGEDIQPGVFVWQLEIEGYLEDGTIYNDVLSGSVTVVK